MHRKDILILAYDGTQPIDIAGPLQAFATANEDATRTGSPSRPCMPER
jgi:putative intracellular protease/amidase